ncbi:MAG TPA: sigma-54 dependent transcriptional regulator [Candidatus Acidoferrales bacterium]|jgi:DNA-binding NtrC family response regulator|nr:sigma-54 dependent transcriptional regulator [Candidatus Acidoferrales bacterium]
MAAKRSILVVEDEPKLRRLVELQLADDGYDVKSAPDAESGLKLVNEGAFDLIITDLKLPKMSGLELLQEVKRTDPQMPVVIMTAFGSVESAVDAMKAGASDYVLKPFSLAELVMVVRKELDTHQLREENRNLREALGRRYEYKNIVAQSEKMQAVLALVERVAPSNVTVLVGGESGVGKDLVARAIHEHSQRARGPFIKINSTAIPETLLESELFGYEKGAFSGATTSKPGKFELADRGTLFLDEIGDVPAAIQVKLLRVLQEKEFERLGGTKTLKVDVRLIAATNRDLRAALEEGTFREDLYYRLNVVPIDIPPLREHKEDIPALVKFFLEKFSKDADMPIKAITPAAMKALVDFQWPGNVRELENVIQRAVTLSEGDTIEVADIHLDTRTHRANSPGGFVLPEGMTLDQWEQETIREALKRANGNKSQAARMLGLSRNALRYRLSQMGVADAPESE